jgi:hypothetical protein
VNPQACLRHHHLNSAPFCNFAFAYSARNQENRNMFGRAKPQPQKVTSGRFEIERDGNIAYLDYTLAGNVLQLIHSEVPTAMRGQGIASELAQSALEWARAQNVKVDVICPLVTAYVEKHPEFADLIL